MGQRGPAPKPTALRVLQGNPGKVPLNPSEPQPSVAAPNLPAPTWLSKEAKEVWLRLRPDLPWLTVADVDVLAAYCATFVRWRDAEDFLEANGLSFVVRGKAKKGKSGEIKFVQQWPQVNIAKQALQMMCKLGGELGLSPASRTRIRLEEPKGQSPKDKQAERMFG